MGAFTRCNERNGSVKLKSKGLGLREVRGTTDYFKSTTNRPRAVLEDRFSKGYSLGEGARWRADAVGKAQGESLRGFNAARGEDEVGRTRGAQESGESNSSAQVGHETKADLRETEDGRGLEDTEVTASRDFSATTVSEAIDGRDDRDREGDEAVEERSKGSEHGRNRGWVMRPDGVDEALDLGVLRAEVHSRTEGTIARAREDDDPR